MNHNSKKRDVLPLSHIVTAYVDTIYFDMDFNYIEGRVGQTIIAPGAAVNWESETCTSIPYVRYEYTRVSKKSPETSRSGRARTNRAKEKVMLFAKEAKTSSSVLRVIKQTVVTKLYPDGKAITDVETDYLVESYNSLSSDPIASATPTSEFSSQAKEIGKGASGKNVPKRKGRRKK